MNYSTWLFDGDGVLYIENKILGGVTRLLKYLSDTGKRFGLITNNSTKTLNQYLSRLHGMDLPFTETNILTSAYASTKFIKGEKVYVVGEEGLIDACKRGGFAIVLDRSQNADAVVVGMDRCFDYDKMKIAMYHVLNGAKFIGTNPDKNFPSAEGLIPGAGAMISAIASAAERAPDIIVGKPERYMFEEAIKMLGGTRYEAVMVGDRFETDILGAHRYGLDTILVRTGIGARYSDHDIENWQKEFGCPKYVFDNMDELFKALIS